MALLVEGDLPMEWYDAAVVSQRIGVDMETSGLNKLTDRIATVQIFVPEKGTIIIRKLKDAHWLGALLESPLVTKIFHNASFDLAFLVRDLGVWPQSIADTKIAARILDPKKLRFKHPITGKGCHSLLCLVKYFHNIDLDKSIAVSNWFAEELDPAQLAYAENDVIYLPGMLQSMEAELLERGDYRLTRNVYNGIVPDVILTSKNIEDVYKY